MPGLREKLVSKSVLINRFCENERDIIDIDATARVESEGCAVDLFGECKMRNRLTGFTELDEVIGGVELTKLMSDRDTCCSPIRIH